VSENTPSSTTKFLEQSYGKKFSEAETLDYKEKLIQFFSLLIEIDQKKRKEVMKYDHK